MPLLSPRKEVVDALDETGEVTGFKPMKESNEPISEGTEIRDALVSLIIWTIFTAIFAYYYRGNRADWDPQVV